MIMNIHPITSSQIPFSLRITVTLFAFALASVSCQDGHDSTTAQTSLGIYLTRDNVPPAALAILSHVEPSDEPLISMDDITSYTWSTHMVHVSERARRILDTLSVPVSGKSFCVCINRLPKYCGAFWTPISSIPFSGTTILMHKPTPDSVRIGRGYPVDRDSTNPDPRNNAEVEAALRSAGKLR
jgi:hypothetical protein